VSGKQLAALALRQIAPDASRQRGPLDESGNLLVVESLGANSLAVAGNATE
jgi:hypothetical protein